MKIIKNIFSAILLIIVYLFQFIKSEFVDDKGFYEILNELSQNTFVNQNRKMVFFYLNPKKKKLNYSNYLFYLQEFLKTTGVQSSMYNWNNKHFIAITEIDKYINKEEILKRFKGIILDVAEGSAKDILEKKSDL